MVVVVVVVVVSGGILVKPAIACDSDLPFNSYIITWAQRFCDTSCKTVTFFEIGEMATPTNLRNSTASTH